MVDLRYLERESIGQIPHRLEPFAFASYAPLAEADGTPDAVLLQGNARAMMLLAEAALAAGLAHEGATMGRPTCSILPETVRTGRAVPSFGCAGNRIYTGLPDGELWYGLPGPGLESIVSQLAVIAHANRELDRFHAARVAAAQ
jgi:uncharacterized protein (DUF169 family)